MPSGDLTRTAVLALLGSGGALSRAEIARALEVSPATVTQVTRDLLSRGMVVEVEQAPSQGGRPGQRLALVGSAGHAVGVKVAADHVAMVDVGLDGVVIGSWSRDFDGSSPAAAENLASVLREVLANVSTAETPLLGVGVGVPGSVDDQASGVVDAPTLGWTQLQLGAHLRTAMGVPVLVENDVNALAAAERLYGHGRQHRDFLVVTIGRGIGASLVTGGSVYRGSRGGAGEIGHMPVTADGPTCGCGSRGCLEAVIGEDALLRTGRRVGLRRLRILEDLVAAAGRGDARAQQVFSGAAETLGLAVAGLINVVDPEILVVLGEGTQAWPWWEQGFERALRGHLLPLRRAIPVEVGAWDDTSWALGAAALVLSTPFDSTGATGSQGALVRARLNGQQRAATLATS